MSDIDSQMESFFRNFFNTDVPGFSHNVEFSENQVDKILQQEFPDAWDPIEKEWKLWRLSTRVTSVRDMDGNSFRGYEPRPQSNKTRSDFRQRQKQLRNQMSPDYYTIIDGVWLSDHANLIRAGIPNLSPQEFNYGETQEWLDLTRGRKSVSITTGRTRYWIFSDGAIFLLLGGNDAMVMTRDQMIPMVENEMIAGKITTYLYGQPLLNWFAYPFNPKRFFNMPKSR